MAAAAEGHPWCVLKLPVSSYIFHKHLMILLFISFHLLASAASVFSFPFCAADLCARPFPFYPFSAAGLPLLSW